jgi:hypothetical protein
MGKLKIGEWEVEVVKRIEQKREEYPYCDSEGKPVTAERVGSSKTTYKNQEGVILSKVYKLIGGKPYDKFKKTEKVAVYQEVPKVEAYDLIEECSYLCKNDKLRQKLQQEDKALRFIYTSGNGYKAYESYLMPYGNSLIMACGFGSKTQIIQAILSQEAVADEESEVEVERANPEQLLVIQR